MNIRFNMWKLLAAVWLPLVSSAGVLEGQPGYVDFAALEGISEAQPKVEIDLGPGLLGFLAEASREEDAELSTVMHQLVSVRLLVYELSKEQSSDALNAATLLAEQLETQGWERAVLVRDEDAVIRMYTKSVDQKIAGMTVLVVGEDGESVFINVVGEIDATQLGRLAAKLGVAI